MPALPSLRQLSYLIALSETRNFTQAAQAQFVTQSTLSGGIQELERLLGAQLVERDRQHVMLSPVGLEVVERARVLLAQANDLVEHVTQSTRPLGGLVRLGAIPTVAPYVLPGLLHAAHVALPDLQIALREERTAELLDQVRAGSLDFALIALPYDTGNLRIAPLFDEELWLIASNDAPATRDRRPSLESIGTDQLLLLAEGHCLRDHVLQACDLGHGERKPSGAPPRLHAIEATSLTTLVQMVQAGFGLALVPEMAVRGGIAKGLNITARPLGAPVPRRGIALVTRTSCARLEVFMALAELARQVETRRRQGGLKRRA